MYSKLLERIDDIKDKDKREIQKFLLSDFKRVNKKFLKTYIINTINFSNGIIDDDLLKVIIELQNERDYQNLLYQLKPLKNINDKILKTIDYISGFWD